MKKRVSFDLEQTKVFYTQKDEIVLEESEPTEIILKKCEELKELRSILTMNREIKPKTNNQSGVKTSFSTAIDNFQPISQNDDNTKKFNNVGWNSNLTYSHSSLPQQVLLDGSNQNTDYNNFIADTLK